MLDHIIISVRDLARSIAFYEQALRPLGITHYIDYKGENGHPDFTGFGRPGNAFFWLKDGRPSPASVHFGFVAKNKAEVDAFYREAIAAGGRDNGAPEACLEYDPGYYAGYVFDPDGYNVEAVFKEPA